MLENRLHSTAGGASAGGMWYPKAAFVARQPPPSLLLLYGGKGGGYHHHHHQSSSSSASSSAAAVELDFDRDGGYAVKCWKLAANSTRILVSHTTADGSGPIFFGVIFEFTHNCLKSGWVPHIHPLPLLIV